MAEALAYWIGGIEKVGLGLRGISAAVGPNVKVLGGYRKPGKITNNWNIDRILDLAQPTRAKE